MSLIFVACFQSVADAASGVAAIFMYHHVSPTVVLGRYARALTVSPAEFESQLLWLNKRGCKVVSVDRIVHDALGRSLAACEVALTFDDGYADVAVFAEPLLKRYGYFGTFYISTGFVGTSGHVTLAQIRSLRRDGMEIGAHTVHHVDLTTLSPERAHDEIDASAALLHRWLGDQISSFAYPAGEFNFRIASSVRMLHFDNAVTTQPGDVTARSDRYELPRYRIVRGTGLRLMTLVLGGRARPPGEKRAEMQRAFEHVARERIAGNDPQVAEAIGVALLMRKFPEQILKVHVLALQPATVAGIVLSGVKFHRAVNRVKFAADVRQMIGRAFAAAPRVNEVDVWATVPVAVRAGTPVSGDYAAPTAKTVFSAAVTRGTGGREGRWNLGATYWDPQWLSPSTARMR